MGFFCFTSICSVHIHGIHLSIACSDGRTDWFETAWLGSLVMQHKLESEVLMCVSWLLIKLRLRHILYRISSCKFAFVWKPQIRINEKSTLVKCRQARNHFVSQCWLGFMAPNVVTKAQLVKQTTSSYWRFKHFYEYHKVGLNYFKANNYKQVFHRRIIIHSFHNNPMCPLRRY